MSQTDTSPSAHHEEEPVLVASSSLNYMAQLDALRALAVLAVMLSHFGLENSNPNFQLGVWGVRQFFVLSGFLITGILLTEREKITSAGSRRQVLSRFYIRRALRILPVFYFVLIAAALLNLPSVREMFWWHFAYMGNYYFSLKGSWQGPSSHLWSLAVEEQFYLVWPWLILLVPRRFVLPVIGTAIGAALLFKVIGLALHWNHITLLVSTVSCLDTLGLGALLAWWRHHNPQRFESVTHSRLYRLMGWPLLAAIIAPLSLPLPVFDFLQALFFAWMVHRAAVGFTGMAGRIFLMQPLLACGRISYGIYLYHNFMPFIVSWVLVTAGGKALLKQPGPCAILFMAASFAAATISWNVLEKPLLRLKNRFAYAA